VAVVGARDRRPRSLGTCATSSRSCGPSRWTGTCRPARPAISCSTWTTRRSSWH